MEALFFRHNYPELFSTDVKNSLRIIILKEHGNVCTSVCVCKRENRYLRRWENDVSLSKLEPGDAFGGWCRWNWLIRSPFCREVSRGWNEHEGIARRVIFPPLRWESRLRRGESPSASPRCVSRVLIQPVAYRYHIKRPFGSAFIRVSHNFA